jgi:hypothetical protein
VREAIAIDAFDPSGSDVKKVPRGVDGVAVFSPSVVGPAPFLRRLAARGDEIVVGPSITDDPGLRRDIGHALDGSIGASYADPKALDAYLSDYQRMFPAASLNVASGDLVVGFRDAVEGLLRGLEQADGDVDRLPAALTRVETDLVGGPTRLDAHRQAVTSTSLLRLGEDQTALATKRGVDQSLDGLLPDSLIPSDRPLRCRAST